MDSPVEPDEIRAMALEYELQAVAEQIEDVRSLLQVKDAEVALKYRLIDNKEQENSHALWRIQQMQEEQEKDGEGRPRRLSSPGESRAQSSGQLSEEGTPPTGLADTLPEASPERGEEQQWDGAQRAPHSKRQHQGSRRRAAKAEKMALSEGVLPPELELGPHGARSRGYKAHQNKDPVTPGFVAPAPPQDPRLQDTPSRPGEKETAHLQERRPKRFDIIDPTSGKHIDVAGLRGASRIRPTIETADSICPAARAPPPPAAPRVFSPSGAAAPPLMLPPVVHGVPPLPPAPPLGIAPGPAAFAALGVPLEPPPVFPTLLTGPAWPMPGIPPPLSLSGGLLPPLARDGLPPEAGALLAPRYHPAAHVLAPGELSKPGAGEAAPPSREDV